MFGEWDELERTVPGVGNRRISRELRIDKALPRFAEVLSVKGTIGAAASRTGLTPAEGLIAFRRLCSDLGEQAR